ncbi:hypothetical protein [Nocardia sp. NPDC005998]|uniref:hypothetical protein n=1 Tax=Nocardia sp. NPDC005998 TaxID=3156894 RepID=UPI0033B4AFB9
MSPAYRTAEQYERWHKKRCARCGRFGCFAAAWPEGHVCRTCHDRALRIRGHCPGCGDNRALPGLRPTDRMPICAGCAGFTVSYLCSRCGHEGKLHRRRLCTRCTFADELADLLSDDTGLIRTELAPLAAHLLTMNAPLSGLCWLKHRKVRDRAPADLLAELGRGEIELTHEAFHILQPWRAAAHLEELLMACGTLPTADKQICAFERWMITHLATIADPGHARLIRQFAVWDVQPRLRARAARGPLSVGSRRGFTTQISQATRFLGWLAEHDLTLADCGQAAIDAWLVEHNAHARTSIRGFLLWCLANRLTRRFRLPTVVIGPASPMPQQQRIDLLGRLLTDPEPPLRSRVAAAIVLLYAQPVSRVVRLAVDDVILADDQVLLNLGEPPTPVPGPVAHLLLTWIDQRTNMNTATNRASRWLFPGRRAGQPMDPSTLSDLINALGVPSRPGRVGSLHQHVLELPAPVVADALGYHHKTTTRAAAQITAGWARYAVGPRPRKPKGWKPAATGDK